MVAQKLRMATATLPDEPIRQRAEEALVGRREIHRLYRELAALPPHERPAAAQPNRVSCLAYRALEARIRWHVDRYHALVGWETAWAEWEVAC